MSGLEIIPFAEDIKPAPHQLVTEEFLLANQRCYNLSEMGTGKTLPAVLAIRDLYAHGVCRFFVTAPMSVIRATWVDHFERFAPAVPLLVLDNSAKRRRQLADLASFGGVVIMNPEGLASTFHELVTWRPRLAIIDELAGYYRNMRTQRWKAMNAFLGMTKAACWAFTGSPVSEEVMDVYGQCMLVNPARLPQSHRGGPISYVAMRDMLCNQPWPNKWVPKKGALERAMSFMQPALRFTRRQVMADLPAMLRIRKDIELTEEQRRLMVELEGKAKAEFGDAQITAQHVMTLTVKIAQIVTGSVYDNEGKTVEIPAGPRFQAVVDLFEEVGCTPVIVAVPFVHTAYRLVRALEEKGFRCAIIIGEVNSQKRYEIVREFQAGGLDFLVCHPKTIAHGNTLTRSHTVCWFGPVYSRELYTQLNDRVNRYGQKEQPLLVEFCSTPAERKVYQALHSKEALSVKFNDLFEGQ